MCTSDSYRKVSGVAAAADTADLSWEQITDTNNASTQPSLPVSAQRQSIKESARGAIIPSTTQKETAHTTLTQVLARLASTEDSQRDAGTLNQRRFNLDALQQVAGALNLSHTQRALNREPLNPNELEKATREVRKALEKALGSTGVMGVPKPDILKGR